MNKFIKILLILILLPVFAMIGVIGYLKYADLNPYKPRIEKLLRKYADLDVKINGNLDVGISFKPTIELSDVTVSLPLSERDSVHIGNALLQFSVLPLLKKEIVIDTIETTDVEVFYNDKESVVVKSLLIGMSDYDSPINIAYDTSISGINMSGTAVISSLKDLQQTNFQKTQLILVDNKIMDKYLIDFNGWLCGLQDKLTIEGTYDTAYEKNKVFGQLNVSLAEKIPYIKMNLQSEQINVADFTTQNKKVSHNLFISNAFAEENTVFKLPYEYLKVVNADIDFNIKKIVVQPNIVATDVSGDVQLKNGVFKLNLSKIAYDNNTVSGEVKIESEKKLPYVKLNVSGAGLDLTKFVPVKKADSYLLIKNAQASQLLNNIIIPYEYLKIANADVDVNVKSFVLTSDIKISDIKVNASLDNSVLNAKIKNMTVGYGIVKGTITLNAKNKTLSTDISGDSILLQKLYTPYADENNQQLYVKSGGKTNLLLKINTSGADTNQYLDNMNGQVIAFMDSSVLKIKSLERLQGNIIVQILNTLKISDITRKDMNLSCAVIRSDIKDGLANFPNGIVFNATDFYLVAKGDLNLRNDKISFDLQPFSGKLDNANISSILGSLLKVSGTVNNPKININQTSAAKNVVGFLASGGAYNVGDMLISTDASPCYTALKGTIYASYFKGDDSLKGNISKSYNDVKESIGDVGNNIKDMGKDIKNQAKELGNQLKGLFK